MSLRSPPRPRQNPEHLERTSETQSSPQQNDTLNLRPAAPADVPQILAFIRDLAEYDANPTPSMRRRPTFYGTASAHQALRLPDRGVNQSGVTLPVGFALYFHNYSTWRGHAGIHIEDLYVRPEYRGKGIGKALLTRVAAIAVAEGCTRLQWDVLEWNTSAIGFYEQMGAQMLTEWRTMRVTGPQLDALPKS